MVQVRLPDGSVKDVAEASSAADAASAALGRKRVRKAVAARVGEDLVDLSSPVASDSHVELVLEDSPEGLEVLRHSAAHLMAQAVRRLYPGVKLGIGPVIEDGFYYDFDLGDRTLAPEDLEKIEEEMARIVAEDLSLHRQRMGKPEAVALMEERGEPLKVELLHDGIEGDTVSFYEQGDFVDLCRGPHVPSTGRLQAWKLLKATGAYWRGDEKRQMLQRIYGTAWASKKDLQTYLTRLEEARKRDHRRLGKDLDLFSVSKNVGPGLILWHPKGARVRAILEDVLRRKLEQRGYDMVYTPHVAKLDLWKTSGHTDFYRENMFDVMDVDGQEYQLRPMNCPFHVEIFKSSLRSYRELPMRLAEIATVYRYERSGVLHGMLRVRGFTQDDAHIFCMEDQVVDEVDQLLDLTFDVLRVFGFEDVVAYLSTRPEKMAGEPERWDMAEGALREVLTRRGTDFRVDAGGGVFYGPKIDVKIRDAIGREWQCTTIQFDFNLPERFDLRYIGKDGAIHRPYMVHRAIYGSVERFFGVLLEHYAGAFPVWLAPVQARVLPVVEAQDPAARDLVARLRREGFRVEGDMRSDRLSARIRDAHMQKAPYTLVLGEREVESGSVAVRHRSEGDLGPMPVETFVERLRREAALPLDREPT